MQQDAQGDPFLNASHCRGFEQYTHNAVHNYAAEQAWLLAATSNYTRTTLTCEDLPRVRYARGLTICQRSEAVTTLFFTSRNTSQYSSLSSAFRAQRLSFAMHFLLLSRPSLPTWELPPSLPHPPVTKTYLPEPTEQKMHWGPSRRPTE